MNKIIHGDSLEVLKTLEADSVDVCVTDPPYGYNFMGKHWDKALPDIGIFKECLRVLKPGAFAFVMSAPRSDVCSRMALLLEDAGFNIAFTPIYWTYASGFPKAMNIGKMVDKRGGKDWNEHKQVALYIRERMESTGKRITDLNKMFSTVAKANHWTALDANNFCMPTKADYLRLKPLLGLDGRFDDLIEREEAERRVIGKKAVTRMLDGSDYSGGNVRPGEVDITAPATDAAKALDGSYGGFQPKPAVEVIIVAMKPLSEKTFVDQALKNGKGITWLDDCRVPSGGHVVRGGSNFPKGMGGGATWEPINEERSGRFPANLLVSDDVLGTEPYGHSAGAEKRGQVRGERNDSAAYQLSNFGARIGDHGSYSRFFSLDAWAQTLPFLAVPKASKSEKNRGCDNLESKFRKTLSGDSTPRSPRDGQTRNGTEMRNGHPTVKPLKLMSYLITLGSRPGDVVLDPFVGSGTTCIAAKELGRNFIGIEREVEYVEIAEARLSAVQPTLLNNQI